MDNKKDNSNKKFADAIARLVISILAACVSSIAIAATIAISRWLLY